MYKRDNNATTLENLLLTLREYRELKSDVRTKHFQNFLQSINAHTSSSKIWQSINALVGKNISVSQTNDSQTLAEELLLQYSKTSSFENLPCDIQQRLRNLDFERMMNIELSCARTMEEDRFIDYITKNELDFALSHGKSTSPGEDGITYQSKTTSWRYGVLPAVRTLKKTEEERILHSSPIYSTPPIQNVGEKVLNAIGMSLVISPS
ncbi:hypothetical protein SK128_001944 [Halocaridina rubra]|uniref:Uncharacterized protein n=1 Tax=Halocaridina rubra TaxID=373956 RepID=A0AAN8WM59_HALRR